MAGFKPTILGRRNKCFTIVLPPLALKTTFFCHFWHGANSSSIAQIINLTTSGMKTNNFLTISPSLCQPWWQGTNPQPWDGEVSALPLCYHHWHDKQQHFAISSTVPLAEHKPSTLGR
jgi:hypothetical protein